MRPEFGCRIHDFVFASADATTAGAIALRGPRRAPAVGAAHRRRATSTVSFDAADHEPCSTSTSATRSSATNDRRNLVFPFYVDPREETDRWPCRSPTSTTAGSRTSSTTPSASSSRRCPEWTDHNVSDPGVTLIETFAWMTDQLAVPAQPRPRPALRQVPRADRRVAVPADGGARPRSRSGSRRRSPDVVTIAGRHPGRHASARTPTEAIVFATTDDLPIIPCDARRGSASMIDGKTFRDHTDGARRGHRRLRLRRGAHSPATRCYVGLSEAVPVERGARSGSTPTSRASASTRPTRRWSGRPGPATTGSRARSTRDTTGGLNRDGDVVLHVPRGHVASLIAKQRAGWVRARVTDAVEGQPALQRVAADHGRCRAITIGGTVEAVNAELVRNEEVGDRREGVPGPAVPAQARPGRARPTAPLVLEVADDDGWEEWTAGRRLRRISGPDDRHFALDVAAGEVALGPAVRLADGALRRYGAVPPKGARLRVPRVPRRRRAAGQRRARRAHGAQVVDPVRRPRREPARRPRGGVDGEDIENAKVRGPILLRTRNRAVTAEDFEQLAREAAPEVARVRARGRGRRRRRRGRARARRARRDRPSRAGCGSSSSCPTRTRSRRSPTGSRRRRVIGTRAIVEPPVYRGVTVVAQLRARPRVDPTRLQEEALAGAVRVLPPDHAAVPTGPAGRSGGRCNVGEVYSVLQRLPRDGARRGRAAVRRRPGHRRARRADRSASSSSRTRSCSATSTRSWWRARDAGGVVAGPARRRTRSADAAGDLPRGRLRPAAARRRSTTCWRRSSRRSTTSRVPRPVRSRPSDFLDWLAGWVGIALDETWDEERRRTVVARAVELYRLRGTAAGLAGQVEIQTGGDGGDRRERRDGLVRGPRRRAARDRRSRWSWCGSRVPDPKSVDAGRLDALVAAAKPAHVMHRIELVKGTKSAA